MLKFRHSVDIFKSSSLHLVIYMCGGLYTNTEPLDGSNIHILGVDYGDRIHGPQKLNNALERIKPDLIVHSFSEDDHKNMSDYMDRITLDIKKSSADTSGLESAVERIFELVIPFPVPVCNIYAEMHDSSVAYAFIPDIHRSRFGLAKALALELYQKSAEAGEIHAGTVQKINAVLHQYYGTSPTSEQLEKYWSYLQDQGLTIKDCVRWLLDPVPGRKRDLLARIIRGLAKEEQTVAVPVCLEEASNKPGSLYRKVKNIGVQREVLL